MHFSKTAWFSFLDHGQQDLVTQARSLYERESMSPRQMFHDYSFVVFPMAKAYEGFLKKYFLTLGLVGPSDYQSDTFRIGKSLNPDLPEKYRNHDWVVAELDQKCGVVSGGRFDGQLLSRSLWFCWKKGRNLLFHYFPDHENFITLPEALTRIEEISDVMDAALVCKNDLRF